MVQHLMSEISAESCPYWVNLPFSRGGAGVGACGGGLEHYRKAFQYLGNLALCTHIYCGD